MSKISLFLQNNRKKILIFGPVIGIILFAGIVAGYRYFAPAAEAPRQEEVKPAVTEKPAPTTAPSLFTGLEVKIGEENRRSVAAMIENSQAARPQIGLTSADIVYEAVTEGGITRFMAIYSTNYPAKAGPIRSARSYFIDWLSEYDSIYVHAGGSPTAISRISQDAIKDYPHSNDGTYVSEPKPGVASEHTLFANISKIFQNGVAKKGWSASHNFSSWKFKKPDAPTGGGTITIDFSTAPFKVVWSFDLTSNKWLRTMAGLPHKDRLSGEQISANNVVVMIVQRSANPPYAKTGKESEWTMQTIGSGSASVFRDGIRIDGTWQKPSRTERTRFYSQTGEEIELSQGTTWIEVLPQTGTLSFAPTAATTQ
jgi:hypothetical protein